MLIADKSRLKSSRMAEELVEQQAADIIAGGGLIAGLAETSDKALGWMGRK